MIELLNLKMFSFGLKLQQTDSWSSSIQHLIVSPVVHHWHPSFWLPLQPPRDLWTQRGPQMHSMPRIKGMRRFKPKQTTWNNIKRLKASFLGAQSKTDGFFVFLMVTPLLSSIDVGKNRKLAGGGRSDGVTTGMLSWWWTILATSSSGRWGLYQQMNWARVRHDAMGGLHALSQ